MRWCGQPGGPALPTGWMAGWRRAHLVKLGTDAGSRPLRPRPAAPPPRPAAPPPRCPVAHQRSPTGQRGRGTTCAPRHELQHVPPGSTRAARTYACRRNELVPRGGTCAVGALPGELRVAALLRPAGTSCNACRRDQHVPRGRACAAGRNLGRENVRVPRGSARATRAAESSAGERAGTLPCPAGAAYAGSIRAGWHRSLAATEGGTP